MSHWQMWKQLELPLNRSPELERAIKKKKELADQLLSIEKTFERVHEVTRRELNEATAALQKLCHHEEVEIVIGLSDDCYCTICGKMLK